ncbi:hypothetical protein AX16_002981 [Volvariella volvacea WC 439]|nr:hypothetical protein AX16_002981 [Volvariella volvacea WC 439]
MSHQPITASVTSTTTTTAATPFFSPPPQQSTLASTHAHHGYPHPEIGLAPSEKLVIKLPPLSAVQNRMVVDPGADSSEYADDEEDEADSDSDDIFGDNVGRRPGQRKIAGSRRVARYREAQMLLAAGAGVGVGVSGQALQSTTPSASQRGASFGELRAECHSQAQMAGAHPPQALGPYQAPWAVVPPRFVPTAHHEHGYDHDVDIVMDTSMDNVR